jgi:hypothetical protein
MGGNEVVVEYSTERISRMEEMARGETWAPRRVVEEFSATVHYTLSGAER